MPLGDAWTCEIRKPIHRVPSRRGAGIHPAEALDGIVSLEHAFVQAIA
jgi:hypothetical protein